MDIQREAHGDGVIVGEKFPQDNQKKAREKMMEQQEGEPKHNWVVRTYLMKKNMAAELATKPEHERDFHDMNPDGFWEMAFSVKGIIYHPQFKMLLHRVRKGDFHIVKVVSQGLLASDPTYIGKVLYSIRHPRAVAKSQERLVRGFNYVDPNDGKVKNSFEDLVIHTPEMYIAVTQQAVQFLLGHPEVPVRFHHFEDLVSDPKRVIDDMAEFVGCGDYTKAYDVVKPKLNRSKHEEVENSLWEDAEFVYKHFCEAAEIINSYKGEHHARLLSIRKKAFPALQKILMYLANPKRNFNREKRAWPCYRAKQQASEAVCRECSKGGETMRNFRTNSEQTASQHGVTKHWSKEPCLWECGMDIDRKDHLTLEDSVANHSWGKYKPEPVEAEPVEV